MSGPAAELLAQLIELDTPTVADGLELLGVRDPSAGYTGPDVRALKPEMGVRAGIAVTAARIPPPRAPTRPPWTCSGTCCGT